MKTKINTYFILLLVALSLFSSCKKDEDSINVNITPVKSLYAPEDKLFVKLQPTTEASVVFEWENARAEDGTIVMYEVAFDKEGGDFSSPIYKLVSDNKGIGNRLTLSHKDLNKIANFAGINALETGKIKWTVLASKGINVKQSEAVKILELQRPAGFAVLPADLYLTGDATEKGADLASAIKFKQTSPGVFEIYTSLKAGSYQLVDRNTGTPKKYYLDGAEIKEEGTTTVEGGSKVYRLKVDFTNAEASIAEVTKVELFFPPENKFWFDLPYIGNSSWQASDVPVIFKQESWGKDERYKFRFTFNKGGTEKFEWFGSSKIDNSRAEDATPLSYWFMLPISESQWDYSFKFNGLADNKNCDIKVMFDPASAYTHQVIVK